MRLIKADDIKRVISETHIHGEAVFLEAAHVENLIDGMPTIDPESLRPTAHIMRGTVQCTHDAGFCSNCKLCIDEDYGVALAKSYNYCPHCGARMVNDDADE